MLTRQAVVAVLGLACGAAGSEEAADGGSLSFYPPSVHHKYYCAFHGVWANSCDINITDDSVLPDSLAAADWSTSCDPWKAVTQTLTATYDSSAGVWKDLESGATVADWPTTGPEGPWTCPTEYQSISGCGDFITDTRGTQCSSTKSLFNCRRPNNADRRVYSVGELPGMEGPQRHTCIQHPIFFDNPNTEAPVVPPALGRHRERWATWGEYDFLPPQRWMHNNEHGGLIVLYHPCLDEESLCALRRWIQKWQARIGKIEWREGKGDGYGDTDDEFRFVLTPFKDLFTHISLVFWGNVYSSICYNERDMDYFVEKHYRNAFEDWPPNGAYNYLHRDIAETAASCPPLPATADAEWRYMNTRISAPGDETAAAMTGLEGDVDSADAALQAELAKVKQEKDDLATMTYAALGLSAASLLLVLILAGMLMMKGQAQGGHTKVSAPV